MYNYKRHAIRMSHYYYEENSLAMFFGSSGWMSRSPTLWEEGLGETGVRFVFLANHNYLELVSDVLARGHSKDIFCWSNLYCVFGM